MFSVARPAHLAGKQMFSQLGRLASSAVILVVCISVCSALVGCALPGPDEGPAFGKPLQTKHTLIIAQAHFSRGEFGLAEKNYRAVIEEDANNPEAWLGLAASYDHLARFDLADRSYKRAKALIGESSVLLNNRGYSFMLRGDLGRARKLLVHAQRLDPMDERIVRNIEELNTRLEKIGQKPVQL